MTNRIVDGLVMLPTGILAPARMCSKKLWNRAMTDINENNTWCPDITRIIYNTKTSDWKRDENGKPVHDKNGKKVRVELESPILATTVEFNDDTKVTVTNSINDKIGLAKDEKTGVVTASDAAKEAGLVYAIVKKLIGKADDKGTVTGNGYGRILRDLVAGAWDQNVEEKRAEMQKAVARAKHEDLRKNAKPKAKRMSLAQAMDKLSEVVKDIESIKSKVSVADSKPARKLWAKKPTKASRKRDAKGRFL